MVMVRRRMYRITFVNREIYKGKYKQRKGGSMGGQIRVGTLSDTLSNIIDTGIAFAAKGKVNDDILRTLNNRDLVRQINRTFGPDFMDALNEKAQQATGTIQSHRRTRTDKLISWAYSAADRWRLSRLSTGAIMASSAQLIRPYLYDKASFGKGASNVLNPFIVNKMVNDPYYKRRDSSVLLYAYSSVASIILL